MCLFLIWDFGFTASYCGGICSEPLWFWFLSNRKHTMVFNFLNSNLSSLILIDRIMIALFCICLFHWRIWSSRFFATDLFSFIFIIGWIFLMMAFLYYNFCELAVWQQQFPINKRGLDVFGFTLLLFFFFFFFFFQLLICFDSGELAITHSSIKPRPLFLHYLHTHVLWLSIICGHLMYLTF